MNGKKILVINPDPDRTKPLTGGKSLELFGVVFIGILRMNGFSLPEPE
jgi:hypothetical protein